MITFAAKPLIAPLIVSFRMLVATLVTLRSARVLPRTRAAKPGFVSLVAPVPDLPI